MKFKGLFYLVISLLYCFSNQGSSFRIRRELYKCNELIHDNNLEDIPNDDKSLPKTTSLPTADFIPFKFHLENEDKRWGTSIYYDEPSFLALNETVRSAFNSVVYPLLKEVTCLRFEAKEDEEKKDYIYFTNEPGSCAAENVGKIKGKNIINLPDQCNDPGIILREIMHALGFEYEHQRPDRDKYITIQDQHISDIPKILDKFEKLNRTCYNLNLPYDYNSVTHFYEKEFSKHDEPTIITTTLHIKDVGFQTKFNRTLSELDRFKINYVYQCYELYPEIFNPQKCSQKDSIKNHIR